MCRGNCGLLGVGGGGETTTFTQPSCWQAGAGGGEGGGGGKWWGQDLVTQHTNYYNIKQGYTAAGSFAQSKIAYLGHN